LRVTESILGHSRKQLTRWRGRCSHLHEFLDEEREALEMWGKHVASL